MQAHRMGPADEAGGCGQRVGKRCGECGWATAAVAVGFALLMSHWLVWQAAEVAMQDRSDPYVVRLPLGSGHVNASWAEQIPAVGDTALSLSAQLRLLDDIGGGSVGAAPGPTCGSSCVFAPELVNLVFHQGAHQHPFVGSPSVALFRGRIFVAWDTTRNCTTWVSSSGDGGLTWSAPNRVAQPFAWGSLFVAGKFLYIIGVEGVEMAPQYGMGQEWGPSDGMYLSIASAVDPLGQHWSRMTRLVGPAVAIHTANLPVVHFDGMVHYACKDRGRHDRYRFLRAKEDSDLLEASAWTTLATADEPDEAARHSLVASLGVRVEFSEEGVLFRPVDPDGRLLANEFHMMARLASSHFCNIAALFQFRQVAGPIWEGKFMHYTVAPGWGSSHGVVWFDDQTGFHFMINNYARDLTRPPLNHLKSGGSTRCELQRTVLALYYSHGGVDWHVGRLLFFSKDRAHHAAYPHIWVDGPDIWMVARGHMASPEINEQNVAEERIHMNIPHFFEKRTAGIHWSNEIGLWRIRDFRSVISSEHLFWNAHMD